MLGFWKHVLKYFTDSSDAPSSRPPGDVQTSCTNTALSNGLVPIYDIQGTIIGYVQVSPEAPQRQLGPSHPIRGRAGYDPPPPPSIRDNQPVRADISRPASHPTPPLQHSQGAAGTHTAAMQAQSTAAPTSSPPGVAAPQQDGLVWDGWPDGFWERNFTWEEVEATGNLMVHWACESAGSNDRRGKRRASAEHWEDGTLLLRHCQGIIECDNDDCSIIVRPQTRPREIWKQTRQKCRCGGSLTHLECPGKVTSKIWTYKHGKFYRNGGPHQHARPTHKLHLLKNERAEFEAIVRSHPTAGPMALLVGIPGIEGPGRSVADISSVLTNKDRITQERRLITQGSSGSGGSAETFISDFAALEQQYPDFFIFSQIGRVTVIVMQTSFMRSQLIKDFIASEPVNGLVTDAAHGFWRNRDALLIISSVFSKDLLCWMPVLFTYSNGASADHYECHFFALYESIGQQAELRGIALTDELFLDVVDFSEAQRLGKTGAFVRFWCLQSADNRSKEELQEDAAALVKGCRQHFDAGVTRLTRIAAVIPVGRAEAFKYRVEGLFGTDDKAVFQERASLIIKEFPKTEPWLAWWTREAHAPLLFPAYRKMDTALWAAIPDTTNAEEAMHWKIYSGTGRDHALLEGIRSLHAFSEHYERLVTANLSGAPIRYGEAQPWKLVASRIGRTKPSRAPEAYERRRKTNDGRPPDTTKELLGARKQRDNAKQRGKQTATAYHSYPWSNNSCWLDTALELVFNVVGRDYQDFSDRLQGVPHNTCLWGLYETIDLRRSGHYSSSTRDTMKQCSNGLAIQRDAFRARLKKYRCIPAKDVPLALFGWLSQTLNHEWLKDSCVLGATYFHGYRLILRSCATANGGDPPYRHYQITSQPLKLFELRPRPNDYTTFNGKIQNWFRRVMSANQSLSALSQCWKTKDGTCLCKGEASDVTLTVLLPVCLIIWIEDDDPNTWDFPMELRPFTKEAAKQRIVYDIVGRGLFGADSEHFIGRFRTPNGKVYTYDGLLADGCATRNFTKTSSLLSGPAITLPSGYKTNAVVYHLRGGTDAQRTIYAHQIAAVKRLHHIVFTQEDLEHTPTVALDMPGVERMPDTERVWLDNPYSKKTADYRLTSQPASGIQELEPSDNEATLADPPSYSSPVKLPKGAKKHAQKRRILSSSSSSSSSSESSSGLGVDEDHDSIALNLKTSATPVKAQKEGGEAQGIHRQAHSSHSPAKRAKNFAPSHEAPGAQTGTGTASPFFCRCGLHGSWTDLQIGEPAIQCNQCKRWSHIACQKGGHASLLAKTQKFICDDCMLLQLLNMGGEAGRKPMRQKTRPTRSVQSHKSPETRLVPGKGALVRHGDTYWYPVRLIMSRQKDKHTEWRVKWWRGSVFADESPRETWVSAASVVDELWQNREARRRIRLGRWHMACQESEVEDKLLDFDAHAYTPEIAGILAPHQELLTRLVYQPEEVVDFVPALDDVSVAQESGRRTLESLKNGLIPHTGELSLLERGQINNWIVNNIREARKNQNLWIGRVAYAHAVTLILASRHRERFLREPEFPRNASAADQQTFILQAAYRHQKEHVSEEYLLHGVDVDRECLFLFEERLFENSAAAGSAGNHQWGLDAGPHQDNWNPYTYTPPWWNHEDREERDSEIEHGPDYQLPDPTTAVPRKRKAAIEEKRPAPRPAYGSRAKQDSVKGRKRPRLD